MRILTIKELRAYFVEMRRLNAYREGNASLFIASRHFALIEQMNFTHEPIVSCSNDHDNDYVGIYYARLIDGNVFIENRSTLDMNIPINNYNDWYCFTTEKEAIKHAGKNAQWINK